jgi:glycosyltransferase involved in cell wall biosynthesis
LLLEDVLFTRVDWYLCPSEAVRNDLVTHWGVKRERAVVVPYGVDAQWLERKPSPTQGRVLFVGTADLRKGIHYLAMAAEKLAGRGGVYEFRIAGNVQPSVARQSVCRHLEFLGRVPRDRIAEEFAAADVFVLPSLAEGSAEASYEALASGVPVITTGASGSVVRDGVEGRIVPERDPASVAAAIEELVEDRTKRERMSAAARKRAMEFTWEKYGERLIATLKSFSP